MALRLVVICNKLFIQEMKQQVLAVELSQLQFFKLLDYPLQEHALYIRQANLFQALAYSLINNLILTNASFVKNFIALNLDQKMSDLLPVSDLLWKITKKQINQIKFKQIYESNLQLRQGLQKWMRAVALNAHQERLQLRLISSIQQQQKQLQDRTFIGDSQTAKLICKNLQIKLTYIQIDESIVMSKVSEWSELHVVILQEKDLFYICQQRRQQRPWGSASTRTQRKIKSFLPQSTTTFSFIKDRKKTLHNFQIITNNIEDTRTVDSQYLKETPLPSQTITLATSTRSFRQTKFTHNAPLQIKEVAVQSKFLANQSSNTQPPLRNQVSIQVSSQKEDKIIITQGYVESSTMTQPTYRPQKQTQAQIVTPPVEFVNRCECCKKRVDKLFDDRCQQCGDCQLQHLRVLRPFSPPIKIKKQCRSPQLLLIGGIQLKRDKRCKSRQLI